MLHHKGNYRLEYNITAGKMKNFFSFHDYSVSRLVSPRATQIFFLISETCHSSLNQTTIKNMLFPSGSEQSHVYCTFLVLLHTHFSSTSGQERYYMYLQRRKLSILEAPCFASHKSHEQ